MNKRKKQAITLLEIMIVIFLIGLIGSVIGYNVKGSLEEGKAFRTEQGMAQIQDILSLEASDGTALEEIAKNPEFYLKRSGLCKDPKKLLKDGWGLPYKIEAPKRGSTLKISSESLVKHKKKKFGKDAPQAQQADFEEDQEEE